MALLSLRDVSVVYHSGGKDVHAINRVSLDVEQGESLLSGLGFRDFRLRLTANGCKLQMKEDQLPRVLDSRGDILAALSPLFSEITLDLRPRVPIE